MPNRNALKLVTVAREIFSTFHAMAWRNAALFALLLFALVLHGQPGSAQSVVHGERIDRRAPLENPHFDILVVTVIEVDPGPFTNANPPRGRVRIEEVLRGEEKPGTARVVWGGSQTVSDYDPAPENKGGKYTPGKLKPEWYARPLKAPKVGDRLIVFMLNREFDGSFGIQSSYAYSDENREIVLEQMAPPERNNWAQAAAFFALLACPFLSFACYLGWRRVSVPPARKRILVAVILLLPLFALSIYGYYESGISIYSNIRIDVLLIWPALALTFAVWPVLGLSYLLSRRKGNP